MKKTLIIYFALLILGITAANAQGLLDKIDNVLKKADRAATSTDNAGKTGSKVASLFGKKKTAEASLTKTTVKITGADFAMLKGINEKLQSSKEIGSTKMKFSSSGSTIMVEHEGTTEELFKVLQKADPTAFSEKNIEGMDDGEISVKLK